MPEICYGLLRTSDLRLSASTLLYRKGYFRQHDEGGKALIRRVFEAAAALNHSLKIVYVEDYDATWGN